MEAGAAILERPPAPEEEVDAEVVPVEGDEPQEVPSVFSVIQRHLIGRVEVSPPAEDGSRVLRLYSANGQSIVEACLSPQLSEFTSAQLVAVEVIEEDDPDAGPKE